MEVRNLIAEEIAFVQVKSSSDQAELDRYVDQFEAQRDRYTRMIFAVHTSDGLTPRSACAVWTGGTHSRPCRRAWLGRAGRNQSRLNRALHFQAEWVGNL